jgi:hypothetical protein
VRFSDVSDYYRLLITTANERHGRLFDEAANLIKLAQNEEMSHRAFEQGLKDVLRKFSGRLVFILDEVDSLAAYAFAGKIFSQIRSMYFAGRSNFSEFERMTYVLSGVAEPGDLIKDKSVSPFNIGEKIYLYDFSEIEFLEFIERANLDLSAECCRSIFEWTGGNPRMTWDVCSALEDVILTGAPVTIPTIEAVVRKLYLESYDLAPIDHIRSLVATDRDVREALIGVRKGFGDKITDQARSKLYLAGIVGAPGLEGEALKLKNRVIENALSEKWLEEIDRQSRGVLNLGRENYLEGRFEAAVAYFEEYLAGSEIDPASSDAYRLAIAYFNIGRAAKAIDWFERHLIAGTLSNEAALGLRYLLGRAYAASENVQQAIAYFEVVVSSGQSRYSAAAASRLGAALAEEDISEHLERVEMLSKQALATLIDEGAPEKSELIRARSLISLAAVAEERRDSGWATSLYREALGQSSAAANLFIFLRLMKLTSDVDAKNALLDELFPLAVALFGEEEGDIAQEDEFDVALPLLVEFRINGRIGEFKALIDAAQKSRYLKGMSRPEIYVALWNRAADSKYEDGEPFLRDILLEFGADKDADEYVTLALKHLVVFDGSAEVGNRYLDQFSRVRDSDIDVYDFVAFAVLLSRYPENEGKEIINRAESLLSKLRETVDARLRPNIAYVQYFRMQRFVTLGQTDLALQSAEEIMEILNQTGIHGPLLTESTRDHIFGTVEKYIKNNAPKKRVINAYKHIGRNAVISVRFKNGEVSTRKFKHLQRDLVLGNCEIIELMESGR